MMIENTLASNPFAEVLEGNNLIYFSQLQFR